jgi:CAAX protease family protein
VWWRSLLQANGRLRPIWRFLLSAIMVAVIAVLAGVIVGLAAGLRHRVPSRFEALAFTSFLVLPLLLLAFKLLSHLFEQKPLAAVGLAFHERWGAELGQGLAIGGVMMLTVGGLERLLGLASFSRSSEPAASLAARGLIMVVVLLVSATNEELAFRGYPFQRLVDSLGAVGAILVLSALFGIAHLGNPSHNWVSTVNTMLVGVPLAVAYLRTRALWLPIGIHFAWNFLQGFVLGLPVSGIALAGPLMVARVRGPLWLTGGSYGPEGGLLATAVVAAATVYLLLAKGIYTSNGMRQLACGRGVAEPGAPLPAPAADSGHTQEGSG